VISPILHSCHGFRAVLLLLLVTAVASFGADGGSAGSTPVAKIPYKKTPHGELCLHVFYPKGGASAGRPAIVFFFGGGWNIGTPEQFYRECAYFAERGWVAISAEYRIRSRHHTTPFESVADGKSAMRWIRSHAASLGVDPDRIVAAGASAGGQIAAATAALPGLDDPSDDLSVSPRPRALFLLYPVIDNGPGGFGAKEIGERFREFSPKHNITPSFPPAIMFLGTNDHYISVATAREFQSRVRAAGGNCELVLIEGAGHPIYSYREEHPPHRDAILEKARAFLTASMPPSQH